MENMNADDRASLAGSGITLRGDPQRPNPIGGYNQVRVIYCSSDTWNGTRRAVPLDAVHPRTGAAVRYSIHFLGARILDAAIGTLRGDGVARPGGMPDLDEAVEVVLSGDSGGGAGVINNLDRVAALLPGAEVRGLIDAIVGPDLSRLDFAGSLPAAEGLDSYQKYVAYLKAVPDANQGALVDASCAGRHAGDDAVCSDLSHVVRHHVTTPFFVRMALLDSLISSGHVEAMFSDPELGVLTVPVFGRILQRELAGFPMLPQTAEEGGLMAVAPGVFAPACFKHDTLHDNEEVYGVTIAPAGSPLSLFDVLEPWLHGGAGPTAVLTQSMTREDTVCQD
jgi:hypothetical protein